jgi:hypothetical protein
MGLAVLTAVEEGSLPTPLGGMSKLPKGWKVEWSTDAG